MAKKNWIDTAKLTLAEWLELVYDPFIEDKSFLPRSFLSNEHLDEYIATVQSRSHEEVENLLLFLLIESASYPIDKLRFQVLMHVRNTDDEMFKNMTSHTYYRRLLVYFRVSKKVYPWEGNTWILDLLPHSPKAALEVLRAYIRVSKSPFSR
jgi:restriction system protein